MAVGIHAKQVEGSLVINMTGRVDSSNANDVEKRLEDARKEASSDDIVIDLDGLDYVSSAGLRVLMRLARAAANLKMINASSEVYDIFDMTGFTEMFDISKAYRVISVEGCEVIGSGANGEVYRLDPDTIVKVYRNPDSLPEIHRERELARTAFVLGVPTAIPYDVVRVGDGYGSVFELLDAESYAKLLTTGQKTVDEIAEMSVELLKIIHGTMVRPSAMPSMRDVALDWVERLKGRLADDEVAKLNALVEAVPEDNHMMHGDYHIKNVMVQNGESLLIDMDTLCHGYPIFELAQMYNCYVGFGISDHSAVERFMGIPYEQAGELWNKILHLYLESDDEEFVQSVADKAALVGLARIMRRSWDLGGMETEDGRKLIEACRARIQELLEKVDSLLF